MKVLDLVDIVENMALQHSYPGYDVRALQLGLPAAVVNLPAKLFAQALETESTITKLAALRWFWERPGVARRFLPAISLQLDDPDEWVRIEAVRTIARLDNVRESNAEMISRLLADPDSKVKKAAAHALWKLGLKNEAILSALRQAAEDPQIEVKWKAQKALRKLGEYII